MKKIQTWYLFDMLKADVKADVDSLFESLAKAKHNMILAKAKHNMISVILNGQNGQPHNPGFLTSEKNHS